MSIRFIHNKVHNLWRECMFVLYRYHFEQIYNIGWTVSSRSLLNPNLSPAPCYLPHPFSHINKPDWHQRAVKLFILGSHWIRSKPDQACDITSSPSAVCLAACIYPRRKWCHSGHAVVSVWTTASRWRQVETGSKMAPGHSTSCVWGSAVCYIPAAQTSVWISFLLIHTNNTSNQNPVQFYL